MSFVCSFLFVFVLNLLNRGYIRAIFEGDFLLIEYDIEWIMYTAVCAWSSVPCYMYSITFFRRRKSPSTMARVAAPWQCSSPRISFWIPRLQIKIIRWHRSLGQYLRVWAAVGVLFLWIQTKDKQANNRQNILFHKGTGYSGPSITALFSFGYETHKVNNQ